MPLQMGVWTIVSNGIVGQLTISDVGPAGNMTGSLSLGASTIPVGGWWDDDSQKLVFGYGLGQSTNQGVAFATYEGLTIYTGFLFQDPNRLTGVAGAVAYTLVGYITTGPALQATSEKHVLGWYAQIGTG